MKLSHILFACSIIIPSVSIAQQGYNVSVIPAELLVKANAVVRNSTTEIEVKNTGKAIVTHRFAITILNAGGDKHAGVDMPYDKFISIRTFEGTLYSGAGSKIKSLKKGDIKDFSGTSSSELADDNRVKSHDFNYQVYPYTVEYETVVEMNGIFYFPAWMPLEDENMSVEQSTLTVEVPSDYKLRYKVYNAKEPEIQTGKNARTYQWKLANHPAVKSEPYSVPWFEATPSVFLAPTDFELANYSGSMAQWDGLGKFIATLNTGRDVLPPAVKAKVHQLSDGLPTTEEKIKKLYEFMQQNTRYISVQLGIGGWQPFEAGHVAANGYGDCKALSNYMYSLLKEAGIKSYYTLIKAGNNSQSFLADFPSNQFNHAILCVPQNKDTIWLECTSQTTPAGYLGGFTSNRNALLIDENGSTLVRTPRYTMSDNLQARKIKSTLDSEGNLQLSINTTYRAEQQDDVHSLLHGVSKEVIAEYLKDKLSISSYDILSFDYVQDKAGLPSINEKLEVKAYNFATVSGKRIFITPNILNRSTAKFTDQDKRVNPVKILFEYTDTDSVEIEIPSGYAAENIPANVTYTTPFGKYNATFQFVQGKIWYTRKMERNSGYFPASEGIALAAFYDNIYKADRSRIVLVKKE